MFDDEKDEKASEQAAPAATKQEAAPDPSHPDHPEFRQPGTPNLPKHVTFDRQDVVGVAKFQSVTVAEFDSAEKVLKTANMPKGAHIVSPKTGFKVHPKDDLYHHLTNGDVAKIVVEAE